MYEKIELKLENDKLKAENEELKNLNAYYLHIIEQLNRRYKPDTWDNSDLFNKWSKEEDEH